MSYAVIIVAAGSSSRFVRHGEVDIKKPFALLESRPVWMHSAEKFESRNDVKQVIVVVSPDDKEMFLSKYAANIAFLGLEVAIGGKERTDSVENGLAKVRPEIEYVAVHDAARPCISPIWIDNVFDAAAKTGAAILAAPITGTIKRIKSETGTKSNCVICETVSRENLWEAQTPQVFRTELLKEAYAKRGNSAVTDDAELVQRLGHPVTVVPCDRMNIKITTQADMKLAEKILPTLPKNGGLW
ncbi:MAG: 2-C-methyl-D-erythritol 4-phosphate cytidylyltransferase [Thermoguttaceae bacterium]